VADVNGDGRPDFLYCAGHGVLAINTGRGFVEVQIPASTSSPAACGRLPGYQWRRQAGSLRAARKRQQAVPQRRTGPFHRRDGPLGDLAKPLGRVTSAAAYDFRGTGKPDLFLGCFKSGNRYLKNNGDGTFTRRQRPPGLPPTGLQLPRPGPGRREPRRRAGLAAGNEGQESVVLLGAPKRIPVEGLSAR